MSTAVNQLEGKLGIKLILWTPDKHIYYMTSRYPLEYPQSCFKWQKKSLRWEGEGGKRGEKLGKKLKEKKGRNGKEKENHGEGESNRRRASISLKSPMPYPSPTVTLKLDFCCDSDL